MVVSCLDWEPQPIDQTGSLAALVTDPLPGAGRPPATPKLQVLTEVMADVWVAAKGTADPGTR